MPGPTGSTPAVVLSCIDSRTPAELIFDLGVGDIFSVRIAGNVTSRKVLASVEFGCAVAGAKLVLVMGHTRCGAVTAAVCLICSTRTKTTGNGSIQITSAKALRLKVVLPYHPDRIANITGRSLIRNCIRPHMDEMRRRTAKKSFGLRSQSWQDATGIFSSIARQWTP